MMCIKKKKKIYKQRSLYAQTAFEFRIAHVQVSTGPCGECLGAVRILIHIYTITDHVVKVNL